MTAGIVPTPQGIHLEATNDRGDVLTVYPDDSGGLVVWVTLAPGITDEPAEAAFTMTPNEAAAFAAWADALRVGVR